MKTLKILPCIILALIGNPAYADHDYATYSIHKSGINSVSISHDGQTLYSAGNDSNVNIVDIATGKIKKTIPQSSPIITMVTSNDGSLLVTSSQDNNIRIWDIRRQTLVKQMSIHSKPVTALAITPDSRYLVTGSYDKTIEVWDIINDQSVKILSGHTTFPREIKFSKDGSKMV